MAFFIRTIFAALVVGFIGSRALLFGGIPLFLLASPVMYFCFMRIHGFESWDDIISD